jgi:hypothetical protein
MTGNGTNITDITGMMVAGFAKAKESIMRTTTRNGTNVTDITGMMVVGIVKARESIVTMVTGRMVTGMTTTTTVIKVSPTVEAMIRRKVLLAAKTYGNDPLKPAVTVDFYTFEGRHPVLAETVRRCME